MSRRAICLVRKVIIGWANSQLRRSAFNTPGELLDNNAAILEELLINLSEGRFARFKKRKECQESRICNFIRSENIFLRRGLKQLKKDLEVKGPHLIHLLIDLMLHYSVKLPLRGHAPADVDDPEALLLSWINSICSQDMCIENFTSCWRDGRALGALLNHIEEAMCPKWKEWDYENSAGNIKEAMDYAKDYLFGVDKIIDPSDMCCPDVSSIVIITYLSQLLSATISSPGKKFRKVLQSQPLLYCPDYDNVNEPNCETIPKYMDGEYDYTNSRPFGCEEPPPLPPRSEPPAVPPPNCETIPKYIDGVYGNEGRKPVVDAKPTNPESSRLAPAALRGVSEDLRRIYHKLSLVSVEFGPRRVIHRDGKVSYSISRCSIKQETGVYLTKSIPNPSGHELEEEIRESHSRNNLKHENILKLVGLVLTNSELCTIMPKMDAGFLQDFVFENKLDMCDKLLIAKGVAEGLEYIHSKDYVIQKLTLRTCTVSGSSKPSVKIMDLSCLSDLLGSESTTLKQNLAACYKYMPGEVFTEKVYYRTSDLYVYAVFVWTVFNPKDEPYGDDDIYSVISAVARGKRLPETTTMDSRIYRLLAECWHSNRAYRPDFKNVIEKIDSLLPGIGDNGYNMIEEDSSDSYQSPI